MNIIRDVAQAILDGFNRHYELFRKYSQEGKLCFEQADWVRSTDASAKRILGYEERVNKTVAALHRAYPEAGDNYELWPKIKISYIGKLMGHLQSECAETFYNSVACRMLHRDYFNSKYIFWRPVISTEHLDGSKPTYR